MIIFIIILVLGFSYYYNKFLTFSYLRESSIKISEGWLYELSSMEATKKTLSEIDYREKVLPIEKWVREKLRESVLDRTELEKRYRSCWVLRWFI